MESELDHDPAALNPHESRKPCVTGQSTSSTPALQALTPSTSISTTDPSRISTSQSRTPENPTAEVAQDREYQSLFNKLQENDESRGLGHIFLNSVGLKSFTRKKRYRNVHRREKKKILLLQAPFAAVARFGVHLLASLVTIFLMTFNAYTFVNGPDVSSVSKYLLQGAAKLHELAIVGSLAVIIGDILRYKITHDGIEFGLLSSPFSFMGLNFLWSPDFLSAWLSRDFFSAVWPRNFFIALWSLDFSSALRHVSTFYSKTSFILLLIMFSFLAAVAGPASALLFLPSQAWLSTGSSNFYFVGNQGQLWPQHLTRDDLGPKECTEDFPDSRFYCLHGGWPVMRGFVIPEGLSRRQTFMGDAGLPRNMLLWRPHEGESIGMDSWAVTAHMATIWHSYDLDGAHDNAWQYARGRKRRLRDAIEGYYTRVRGKLPVVRTVCGPFINITLSSVKLPIPVIKEDEDWRRPGRNGTLRDFEVDGEFVRNSRVSTTWLSLPSEFGPTTAGLAYITQNETGTVFGCGCAIDARWARGESYTHGIIGSRTWQAIIGQQGFPQGTNYKEQTQTSFFDRSIKENVGSTITADIEVLRALTPLARVYNNSLTLDRNTSWIGGNDSTLEVLLLNTRLWDISWLLEDAQLPNMEIEAVVSAYFVNSISRIGWHQQMNPASYTTTIPILRMGSVENDNLLQENGSNWDVPTNISTSSLKQEWFSYTTAWQFDDPVLYISIVVLALHLFMAMSHMIWVLCLSNGRTSEAWDSIPELIALAYNSEPEGDMLQNCGVSIMLRKTLKQKVKVVAIEEEPNSNEEKVQLIPCKEDVVQDDNVAGLQKRVATIRVGKEYG